MRLARVNADARRRKTRLSARDTLRLPRRSPISAATIRARRFEIHCMAACTNLAQKPGAGGSFKNDRGAQRPVTAGTEQVAPFAHLKRLGLKKRCAALFDLPTAHIFPHFPCSDRARPKPQRRPLPLAHARPQHVATRPQALATRPSPQPLTE